ncbi:sigma 54-interacting transcriptional regulator [Selenihalanaerobacter shriftii]|uniref:HTH-type transcriptional regulatory protein TyrR n=1 Tax=Selenihalanaerobacter shriftii TaxID=142842 RepID=A0A1T4NMC1_9FIRM|nr:sigma 54-interacting transcriptional regulator [Selenihalanaerobacter shriftii]SJZ80247.1 PAS domain S-box-containing protein [Selenihalanaerobacter shriftii]
MKAKDVMIKSPPTLSPDNKIKDAIDTYINHQVNCIPILNDDNYPIGILTNTRVFESLKSNSTIQTPIRKVMETNIETINESTSVKKLYNYPIGRLLILNQQGQFSGIVTKINLIKTVHEKLGEKEGELSALLESMSNGVISIDSKGLITICSQKLKEKLGVKGQVIGKGIDELFPELNLKEIINQNGFITEKREINNNRFIINKSVVRKEQTPIGAVAVFQCISRIENLVNELKIVKELNSELEAVIDLSYDGIIVTDKEKVLRVNQGFERITGVKSKELIGKQISDLELITPQLELVEKIHERKEPITVMQEINGDNKVYITGKPVLDDERKVTKIIFNLRDMTELNNLKEVVEETKSLNRRYHSELEELRSKQLDFDNIIAESTKMKEVLQRVRRVSTVEATVLITGKSGVGKGMITKLIHKLSDRANKPFIEVNCGAIPANLLESELFGYESGSFTNAKEGGKVGLFEAANNGTLFLDEIGELPLELQVKLLKALEEEKIYPIGSTEPVHVDVRILAATNQNLWNMTEQGEFRRDLFYRLNVLPIEIPPLCQRKEDIAPLIYHFLNNFNQKYNTNKQISEGAWDVLLSYTWSGNIRELKNTIERLVIMVEGDSILSKHLSGILHNEDKQKEQSDLEINRIIPLKEAKQRVEKDLLKLALNGDASTREAAKYLGVHHSTIVRKAQKFGITLNN